MIFLKLKLDVARARVNLLGNVRVEVVVVLQAILVRYLNFPFIEEKHNNRR